MMNKLTKPTALFVLSAGLLACQTQTPLNQAPAQSSAATQTRLSPNGELSVKPDASGRPQLSLTVHYPHQNNQLEKADFRTQALNCSAFTRYQVMIQGIGMQTLYPATADAQQNHTIATTGCTLTTSIQNVPFGENRLAFITAYNGNTAVPGSTLAAVFNVSQNPTSVQLSYRSTPSALVAQQLLTAAATDPTQRVMLAQLNTLGLQTFIDGLTGASGNFPNFSYATLHPSLINISALTTALMTAQGNVATLNPADPAFVQSGGSVSGSIAGLTGSDKVNLQLSDPATGQIIGQSNAGFQFQHVPPGSWNLLITPPAGYRVMNPPAAINVTNQGTLDLGQINLGPAQPVVTSLNSNNTVPGANLTIYGSDFYPDPAAYSIVIGGVTVPTANITVVSSTQIQVTVPANVPVGATTVSVSAGGQTAVHLPAVTVFSVPTWSGWGTLGSNTENVLSVTAHVSNPARVFYGSQPGAPSLGGIWRCDNSSCVQKANAATAGAVQALAIDPSNTQIVYAGSSTLGVLKSTDGGETWAASNTNLTSLNVRTLLVDPQRPEHIYAGTATGGVFYSVNSGSTWTAVNTGLQSVNIGALSLYQPVSGNPILYAGTSGAGVARSTGGNPAQVSWESINNGLPSLGSIVFLSQVDVTVLEPLPNDPNKQLGAGTGGCTLVCQLFVPGTPAGGYLSGIWQRTDPANWLQIGHNGINEYDPQAASPNVSTGLSNMNVRDLVFDAVAHSRAYAATDAGVFKSENEGALWAAMNTGLPANLRINAIASHPLKLYIGTAQGLYQAN